jgi:hypothetical protein
MSGIDHLSKAWSSGCGSQSGCAVAKQAVSQLQNAPTLVCLRHAGPTMSGRREMEALGHELDELLINRSTRYVC